MQTTIETQQLALFVTVVQQGGFTAAAQHLDTDKGYVSRSISRIEDRLGVKLLNRTTRQVVPTAAGLAFYDRAVRLLRDVDELENEVRASAVEPSGTFRITVAPEYGRQRANLWFQELLKQHPNLNLEIAYVNRPVDVLSEGMDLAIRLGATGAPELITTKLGLLRYGVYAAPSYLDGKSEIKSVEDLGNFELILFQPQGEKGIEASWSGRNQYATLNFRNGDQRSDVSMLARFRSNNVFATRQMCIAGHGICVIPIEVAELVEPPATSQPDLVRLLPDWSIEEASVNLVYPASGKTDPRVQSLIKIARANLQRR